MMTGELAGRRIIVTGGATGLGAAAVQVFAQAGASVAATCHESKPPLDLLDKAAWRRLDLRDRTQVDSGFDDLVAGLGGLDVLFHAAGLWRASDPSGVTEEDLDFAFATNLKATVFANQAAHRAMSSNGSGRIINVGSSEGVTGSSKATAYALAKAGVHSWTRSAARAWAADGVTVNTIAPAMATRGLERLRSHLGPDQSAQFDERLRALIPIGGRPGDPVRDLGPVLVFLAGAGAGFITGQLLPVDGGLMMVTG